MKKSNGNKKAKGNNLADDVSTKISVEYEVLAYSNIVNQKQIPWIHGSFLLSFLNV